MQATEDYSGIAKLLHWLIAGFVIILLGLGLTMTRIADLQLKFELYQLHKSLGVTVLALMVMRVLWRLLAKPPAMPAHMPGWERGAAHGTHLLLYGMLLLMPLSGWAMVSAAMPPFNFPTVLYGAIPWPHIPFIEQLGAGTKKTVEPWLKTVHAALGWTLLAFVVLHIAAALRHRYILKDGIMLRMLPRFLNSTRTFIAPLAAALAFASALPAQAQEWAVDKSASKIIFEAEAGGQAVTGEFQQFQAEIRFDEEDPESAEISAAIDMNTVSSGQAQVDSALVGKDWFDTQTYPRAGFKAKSVKAGAEEGEYLLEGTLTIKGNTNPVSFPFVLAVDQGEAKVTAETSIKRLDYGIGPSGPVSGLAIGDMVKIKLDIAATRLDN